MSEYRKLHKIGYGTFGDVILAEHINDLQVFPQHFIEIRH